MKDPTSEERNRTFLVRCAVAITILSLILYAFIRDPVLLGISGTGLGIVYRFYFTRRK